MIEQLDEFLAGIEKRAFRMARLATSSDADALDIVQDAMMKLVEHYSEKQPDQWAPLFYRILQNRITDFHRDKKWNWLFGKSANDAEFEMESAADTSSRPEEWLETERLNESILKEVSGLPRQQQQCFLLRTWEGLSITETAEAMNITEGSVKTHYSRAMAKLTPLLQL